MDFTDKIIVCSDCAAEFVHSAQDQARYAERGFTHEPKRCRTCRDKRKTGDREGGGGGGPPRRSYGGPRSSGGGGKGGGGRRPPPQLFDAVCSECGQQTQVPFKPADGRPVFCRACYQARRDSGSMSRDRGPNTAEFD